MFGDVSSEGHESVVGLSYGIVRSFTYSFFFNHCINMYCREIFFCIFFESSCKTRFRLKSFGTVADFRFSTQALRKKIHTRRVQRSPPERIKILSRDVKLLLIRVIELSICYYKYMCQIETLIYNSCITLRALC